jgi:hypothetical protein
MPGGLAALFWAMCWATCWPGAVGAAEPAASVYELDYEARFRPAEERIDVSLTVRQPRHLLREVRFSFDPGRYRDFTGDGEIAVADDEVTWRPPVAGGELRYRFLPDHRRRGDGYDSLLRDDWAVFRGDDLLPPAATTALKKARSKARLRMSGPDGWSFISAYPRSKKAADWFVVDRPDRRFDRPVGWMAAGQLGVRWATIADRQVAVAGPVGHGVRHLDLLAFLRWNLPELVEVFRNFPQRLLVVSAGDPMWRGGLSGPDSLFIHADRPLISGNGTSTLLHELLHVAQSYRAERDEDWIVEGLAEFYTLEIMQRSGTISARRQERGLDQLAEWAGESESLEGRRSAGARTARGVLVMEALDAELRRRSDGRRSLDDVARALAKNGESVSLERLRQVAADLVDGPLAALSDEALAKAP